MDGLELLRAQIALQIEWGADEYLLDAPQNRLAAKPGLAGAPPEPGLAEPPPDAVTPQSHVLPVRPPRPAANAKTAANARAAGLPAPADAAKIAAACDTLEALQAALAAFTGCALRDTATQLVFADGAEHTNLMLIGEAPGGEEDRVGRPFVGPAGQLLDKMLASIKLDRSKLRIVNVVPWRPPGNRAPTESEIAICLPFLYRHIALVQPEYLVLLGATAAKAMLPAPERNSGIRRLRGRWQPLQIPGLEAEIPALPTYHPAYLLRTPSAKRESWLDLIAVAERLNSMV